jgi:DnaB-like helicase C terminal domain
MSSKKTYAIAKGLERATLHLLVTDPRFYAVVGKALDPEMLPTAEARAAAELALAFYRQTNGSHAPGQLIIAQRLRALREEGKVTLEDAGRIYDWLDGVLGEPLPEREPIAFELVRELKTKLRDSAIVRAMELHGRGSPSLSEVVELFQLAERLGQRDTGASSGLMWNDASDEMPLVTERLERLRTSILPLDDALHGGLGRGEFGFGIGAYGAGKSIFLSQLAAAAMHEHHNPFIVTLEISEQRWTSRLKGARAGVLTRSIHEGELSPRDLDVIRRARGGAIAMVKEMPAKVTQIEDVWRAFDEANRELKRQGSSQQFDVLLVDYADKIGYPRSYKGSYDGCEHVYESLRLGGKDRNIWTWTASQAKRKEQKLRKDVIRGDDVADSIHKCRCADVVVTINPTVERDFVRIYVDKDRNGDAAGFTSEYLPVDFDYGRITPPLYEHPPLTPEQQKTTASLPF